MRNQAWTPTLILIGLCAFWGPAAMLVRADEPAAVDSKTSEQIEDTVREVLADANARQSLVDGNRPLVGHDGRFYLESPDRNFRMDFAGQLQFRGVFNVQEDATDQIHSGLELRRAKLSIRGYVFDPRLEYGLRIAFSSTTGTGSLEAAYASYRLDDHFTVLWGRTVIPFLREEIIVSGRQLAAERGVTNEYFTMNFAEMVQGQYQDDDWRFTLAMSDGANSGSSDFASDTSDVAVTFRADRRLDGPWKEADDYAHWSNAPSSAFLGGAVHWELGEAEENYLGATVDTLWKR